MDNQVRKDTRDRREAPVCPDDQAMKDQLARRATRETQDSMVHQDPLDPLDILWAKKLKRVCKKI